jgi:hypothetical protein
MNQKRKLAVNKKIGILVALTLSWGLASAPASAGTICTGCEAIDGAAGTWLGEYDPTTFDNGTFNHTGIEEDVGPNSPFNDFFVFDVSGHGAGSISADFTTFTAISDFEGALWTDGGSTCDTASVPGACSSVLPGEELFRASASGDRWEIMALDLPVGRYIIQVTGTTRAMGPSSYSGQLSFVEVPEPGSLALLGIALAGLGIARRRKA